MLQTYFSEVWWMKKQNMREKFLVAAVVMLLILTMFSGCHKKSTQESGGDGNPLKDFMGDFSNGAGQNFTAPEELSELLETFNNDDMFSSRDGQTDYDEENAVYIKLKDGASSATADNVAIEGDIITVSEGGTYVIEGALSDGGIVVNTAKEEKLQFVLAGVDICCENGAPLYVKQTDKLFVTLQEGSANCLTQKGDVVELDESNIDAAVFSKEDITFNGEGTLVVSSEKGHGIVSKDDLVFTGGKYEVTAAQHAVTGKDSVRFLSGTFSFNAGEDGVHSENDEDTSLGYVYIAGGKFEIDCKDDGIHAGANVIVCDGKILIENSYEGIEGRTIDVIGGEIELTADDDGFNATDGTTSEMGPGGFHGGNMPGGGFPGGGMPGMFPRGVAETEIPQIDMEMPAEQKTAIYVRFSGGKTTVNAGGDGIDSNGALYVNGGEVYVYGPTNNGNGALDYTTEAVVSGGTFFAVGQAGMAMNFGKAEGQGAAMVNISGAAGALLEVRDSEGNVIASCEPSKSYNSVVVSCPGLAVGETYTVSSGSQAVSFNMENAIYGENGMGMGGPGGFLGGNMGGGRPGQNGGRPGW